MNKLLALDLGDQWVGVAISDATRQFARPLTTVKTQELEAFLAKTCKDESIDIIIIGHPITMKGGASKQTQKVVLQKEQLEEQFKNIQFVLWDERLTSQRAQLLGVKKGKEEKLKEHARAAAFILDSYLTYLQTKTKNY